MMGFEDYYWHQFDVLNKDTQLARQFGQDVWDYKQAEVDELQKRIDDALKAFKSDLSPIGKFETIHNILKGATP